MRLLELTGLPSIYSNDSWFAQFVSAPLPAKTDIITLKSRLYEEFRIEVPLLEWNGYKLIRVSVQGYNGQDDIDTLIFALMDCYLRMSRGLVCQRMDYFQSQMLFIAIKVTIVV
jgi:hypothetical protein